MRKARDVRPIDGFLLLDKPAGAGSNAVLQHVKRLYHAARAGHTGTLDPMASGLLPLCFGEATKFAGELLEADKAYRARITLGVRTTTGDAEGEVVSRRPVAVTPEEVLRVLERFRGMISQIPPMHSALKRDGVPLYVHARAGRTLERAAREVRIHALEMLAFETSGPQEATLEISVDCSKGTYIRVLAEDIGEALGCGAHLSALVRTRIGAFRLEQAHTLEALETLTAAERDALLLPVDALLARLPAIRLEVGPARRFCHGAPVRSGASLPAGRPARVYGPGDLFLGTGIVDEAGLVHPKRLVSRPETTAPEDGRKGGIELEKRMIGG